MKTLRRRSIQKLPTERQSQIAIVQYLRIKHPDVLFWATPNGGSRNAIEAANLKKEGVRAGVPDLFIARPVWKHELVELNGEREFLSLMVCAGLFIEMKSSKGICSNAQNDIISKLRERGYRCEVCYSAYEAIKVIDEYLN